MTTFCPQLTFADEKIRQKKAIQSLCDHDYIWLPIGYLENSDETVDVPVCKKCGYPEN